MSDVPRPTDHFQAALYNNKIYCASGRNSSAKTKKKFSLTVSEFDDYNMENNAWETLPESSNIPTQRVGAFSIINKGNLIITGSESSSQKIVYNDF